MSKKLLNGIVFILLIFILSEVVASGDNIDDRQLENIKIEQIGENKKYEFEEGGKLVFDRKSNIYGDKEGYSITNLKSVDGDIPFLILDDNNNVIEAKYEIGDDGDYPFGSEWVELPKGTIVKYKDGVADIKLPDNANVPIPMDVEKKKLQVKYEFSKDNGEFIFMKNNQNPNFDGQTLRIQGGQKLKYSNGAYYFDYNGKAQLNSLQIVNDHGTKTYIDFNGEINGNYQGAYISIDDSKGVFVTGVNTNQIGPAISFDREGNPYGLPFREANDHYTVQVYGNVNGGSYFKITNRNDKRQFPWYESQNQFVYEEDGVSLYYNSELDGLYLSSRDLIPAFDAPSKSSSIHLFGQSFKVDSDGNKVPVMKHNNVVGFGGRGEFAIGNNPSYLVSQISYGIKGQPEFKRGISNAWVFYEINTIESFDRILGIPIIDGLGLIKSQYDINWLKDVLFQLPPASRSSVTSIVTKNLDYAALGYSNGKIELSKQGFNPGTIRHEATHTRDYRLNVYGGRSPMAQLWASIGGNDIPYMNNWGRKKPNEKLSTFMEYVYFSDNFWKMHVNGRYGTRIRARIAALTLNGYMRRSEAARLLGSGGLSSDEASLKRYILEAQGRT